MLAVCVAKGVASVAEGQAEDGGKGEDEETEAEVVLLPLVFWLSPPRSPKPTSSERRLVKLEERYFSFCSIHFPFYAQPSCFY